MISMIKKQSLNQTPQAAPASVLEDFLLTAREMPFDAWQALMQDPIFGYNALCMVWQSEGRRFSVSRGGICRGADGGVIRPAGPVSLAHPVDMDAGEILFWRRWLRDERLTQPVRATAR